MGMVTFGTGTTPGLYRRAGLVLLSAYLRGHARLSMAAIVDASLFAVPGGYDLQVDVPAFTQVIVLTVAASP